MLKLKIVFNYLYKIKKLKKYRKLGLFRDLCKKYLEIRQSITENETNLNNSGGLMTEKEK